MLRGTIHFWCSFSQSALHTFKLQCVCCLDVQRNVSEEAMICEFCADFSHCHSSLPGQIPEKCKCCHQKRPLALVTYSCMKHKYYICMQCHRMHNRCLHDIAAKETLDSEKRFEDLNENNSPDPAPIKLQHPPPPSVLNSVVLLYSETCLSCLTSTSLL